MTAQEVFDADLAKCNAHIARAGAIIEFEDGTRGIDSERVSASFAEAYGRLLQYGYANGLL